MNAQYVGDIAKLPLCDKHGAIAQSCKRHACLQNDVRPGLVSSLNMLGRIFRFCSQIFAKFRMIVGCQERDNSRRVVDSLRIRSRTTGAPDPLPATA